MIISNESVKTLSWWIENVESSFKPLVFTGTMLSKYNLIWISVLVEQKHFKIKKASFNFKKFICNFLSSYNQTPTKCFHEINSLCGPDDIDLFASRRNHQLSRYISYLPDPNAEFVDAFSLKWIHINGFAFPPVSIVRKVVQKLIAEETELWVCWLS
jgi:hypothetical protein